MNKANLALIVPLVLLAVIVTTPATVTENAFARYQRHTGSGDLNQAASITNSCSNPVSNSNSNDNMISNGNCGDTISQQGGSGQASTPTTLQNANPTIEVQRSTTQPSVTGTHTTCTQCFDMLNATQKQAANQTLAGSFDFASGVLPPGITNLVELCNAWNKLTEEQRSEALPDISSLLNQIHVDSATITKITTCLLEVVSVG